MIARSLRRSRVKIEQIAVMLWQALRRGGKISLLTAAIWPRGAQVMAANGLITMPSRFGPKETMNRLEAEFRAKGMTLFARIDHAAGAKAAALSLQPTDLLIFGNTKAGTRLMQSAQTIGIDLPLKALVWQDTAGKTWLSYNDPGWLARRHGVLSRKRRHAQRHDRRIERERGRQPILRSRPRHAGYRGMISNPEHFVSDHQRGNS
jgi:uncharacterized protein (DUF302 family)